VRKQASHALGSATVTRPCLSTLRLNTYQSPLCTCV
jgi:hypothetical protein